jgi:hypothetical protein
MGRESPCAFPPKPWASAGVSADGLLTGPLSCRRRHPRFLARIKPTQLALWSFAVATAHGAGLMLLPIYLGLCSAREQDIGHQAAAALMRGSLATGLAVSLVHAAMIMSGGRRPHEAARHDRRPPKLCPGGIARCLIGKFSTETAMTGTEHLGAFQAKKPPLSRREISIATNALKYIGLKDHALSNC